MKKILISFLVAVNATTALAAVEQNVDCFSPKMKINLRYSEKDRENNLMISSLVDQVWISYKFRPAVDLRNRNQFRLL